MYACTGRYRISMGVTGMAIVRAIVGGERDPGSWRSCGIGAVTRSLRTLPPLVLAHPASAHTPNASCFPDRSPLRWVEPLGVIRLPHGCPFGWFFHDFLTSCYPPSEHDSPGRPTLGFWSSARGELQEPRQCSIAFPEPCCLWGIRTNGKRALAAALFSRSIPQCRGV